MVQIIFSLLAALYLFNSSICCAQSRTSDLKSGLDLRGAPELVVCSQNLKNFGTFNDAKARDEKLDEVTYQTKVKALAERFTYAKCDVIAVQEVLGHDLIASTNGLKVLIAQLRAVSGRIFESVVGDSNDLHTRLGYLMAQDKADVVQIASYKDVELPKLNPKRRPELFERGPLEVQLKIKGSRPKMVYLVNFHLKSKQGAGDATGLDWEIERMQAAEALRGVVEHRMQQSFISGDSILILLGDRNSNYDSASAHILQGELRLDDFKRDGVCRISKRGVPLCQAGSTKPRRLFSVLTDDPRAKHLPGTMSYKGTYSWIDDILLPSVALPFAWRRYDVPGGYNSGVVYQPTEASDHALVYVRLNW